jgi:4-diphosphocytidyl-2-C-methyl-D-erythritol kinase
MIAFPSCKINLGLRVIEKRTDGFHNIESVMYPIGLHDLLEVITASDGVFEFNQTGLELPGNDKDNLVVKAYHLLMGEYNLPPVKIHLHKIIPAGAGLGGGSSDAAFMLKLCNSFFNLGLKDDQLENYAGRLGSDCPFFIKNVPVVATGRGEQFSPLNTELKSKWLVIAVPDVHIDTPSAYSWIKPDNSGYSPSEVIKLPISQWKGKLLNDFENPVFERFPAIGKLRDNFYRHGAVYASMTGSGAGVFALFNQMTELSAEFKNCFFWQGKL